MLYLDESGSHDMKSVDPKWPVFALVGVLVEEMHYVQDIAPAVKSLKWKFGIGGDTALHSRDIRRQEGAFSFLSNSPTRSAFYEGINAIFDGTELSLFAILVDKLKLGETYLLPPDPYHMSLSLLLSSVCEIDRDHGGRMPFVKTIVAERRGKTEDRQLQAEYQRLRQVGLVSYDVADVRRRRPEVVRRVFPHRINFLGKTRAIAGLELADLAAYPIARAFVNQDWNNPAFCVIKRKLKRSIIV